MFGPAVRIATRSMSNKAASHASPSSNMMPLAVVLAGGAGAMVLATYTAAQPEDKLKRRQTNPDHMKSCPHTD